MPDRTSTADRRGRLFLPDFLTAGRAAPVLIAAVGVWVLALAWRLGSGWGGIVCLALVVASIAPGWPVAAYVFGARHGATWIAGFALGYPLTAFLLWIPIALGVPRPETIVVTWAAGTAVIWAVLFPRRARRIDLPRWTRRDTAALAMVVALVPLLVGRPFSRIGERDAAGERLFRAYFTADFVWHMALTAELEKADNPPRNPYRAKDTLHYYWLHFVPPSSAALVMPHILPDRVGRLTVNALGTGMIFAAMVFLFAWMACGGRAGPSAVAVALAFVAASAEGLYLIQRCLRGGAPLAAIREINVDATTYWFFQAVTIDGLQRSLYYNTHHSMACAVGLVALVIVARAGARMGGGVALACGASLGLALMVSPFPGGLISLTWGLAAAADLVIDRERFCSKVATLALAGLPVIGAVGWMVANQTLEGAGSNLRFGLSRLAMRAPLVAIPLAAGPILAPALAGLAASWRLPRSARPALLAVVAAFLLIFFVTLTSAEPWIGWRAGQVMFVAAPGLGALGFAALWDRRRWAAIALAAGVALAGVPTAVLDYINAQDVETRTMGPGFPWTVVVTRNEQEALDWIKRHTKPWQTVQVEPTARGRASWTLIPSFAERRMATGLPISLLDEPAYHRASERVRELYATEDPDLAHRIARSMGIRYLYLGQVELEHYPEAGVKFDRRLDLFTKVFQNPEVRIYSVQ